MAVQDPYFVDAEPYSPAWWREILAGRLNVQGGVVDLCENYYDGDHRLDFGTPLWNDAFRMMFRDFADNWLALVVDSSVERLRVQGFRFGSSNDADQDAWALWQHNNLDLHSRIGHTEAIKTGNAYVLVAPPAAPGGPAQITIEHPSQCVIARNPADRRDRLAGLKRWTDDTGRGFATLYLPDVIYRWQTSDAYLPGSAPDWQPRDDASGGWMGNPLGSVPLFALENNPRLLGGGRSDILGLLPLQDAIDKIVADSIIASEYSSLRQRWATGVEMPPSAEDGTNAPLEATFKRLWLSENPDAKWGEFSVADLNGYVQLISMLTQHLAAISRTPPHYLLGQIVNASGDALKTAEATLVAKVNAKMVDFAETWEDAMRAAFLLMGDTVRGMADDAETLWADPESRTESQHIDALVKQQAIGVPDEILWENVPYSPQTIERMKTIKAEEAAAAPAVPSPMLALVPDGQPAPPDLTSQPQGVN